MTRPLAGGTPIDVVENGVDCSYYTPWRTNATRNRVLFTGTSAPRNVTALRRFVRSTWPAMRHRLPNVELLVAGNFAAKAQREFARVDGIRFTGFIPDIRPYFDESDVFIAPFRETHGSKLKVAEAMAMGMPIVSTREGMRGFPLVHGQSALVADSDQEFAEYVVQLVQDPARRTRIGGNARETALRTVDWPVLGERIREIVRSVDTRNE
ncbi:MAG: glycosyltransferase [Chloroflexota bacterium]